jgi:hypothetical protein
VVVEDPVAVVVGAAVPDVVELVGKPCVDGEAGGSVAGGVVQAPSIEAVARARPAA